MNYEDMRKTVHEFIAGRDRNLAATDVVGALNDACGQEVAMRVRAYQKVFSDADIECLRATHCGQWLTVRDAFAAVGRNNVSHGDAVSGGMQLRHVFGTRKVGSTSMYLIERRESIA